MSYVNLTQLLKKNREIPYAIGAFNIFNYITARAVITECETCRSPVIVQTSVKTVKQVGMDELARLVIPLAEAATVPVVLHLDHCTDVKFAKQCADAGWSSIMYDGSALPFKQNVRNTREIADYVHGKNISIEGELGAIIGAEEDIIVEKEALADVDLSARYTSETGIDAFAPAIGTAHGVYKRTPKLDFERFSAIGRSVAPPLVVHGGTGLSAETFQELIQLGASKINISTALKIAYIKALQNCAQFHDPLQADAYIEEQIRLLIHKYIDIFGSAGRV